MEQIATFRVPPKLITGVGAVGSVCDEIGELGGRKVLVVTDPGVAACLPLAMLTEALDAGGVDYAVFDQVIPEPPMEQPPQCLELAQSEGADLLLGLGGGSSMDVAKVTAFLMTNGGNPSDYFGNELVAKPGVPTILMPTTAGTASEVTNVAILKDRGAKLKEGIVTQHNYCKVGILDPRLTLSVPTDVSAATGMDALIHAIECYISVKATDMTDTFALKAISLCAGNLRRVCEDGSDLAARTKMQQGCLIGGISFANAGVGGVHALSYPLGGAYDVPHGVANSLMMLPVLRFNAPACAERMADIGVAMGLDVAQAPAKEGADAALDALAELVSDIGIPPRLRDVGVAREDLEAMADSAMTVTRLLANNPRPLSREDALALYEEVY